MCHLGNQQADTYILLSQLVQIIEYAISHQGFEIGEKETNSSTPQKARTLNAYPNSFASQEVARSYGNFVLFISHWVRKRDYGEWAYASQNCCLCSQWTSTWCSLLSTLSSDKTNNQFKCWIYVSDFSFPSQEKPGGETFFFIELLWGRERLWGISAMDFPNHFHAALIYFTWGVGAFHWFLNFFQRELVCILL